MCADGPGEHTGGECSAGSRWSGAVGRDHICQIQGMHCSWGSHSWMCVSFVCKPPPFLPPSSISASFSETTSAPSWVPSSGHWGPTPAAAAASCAAATGAASGNTPSLVTCSLTLMKQTSSLTPPVLNCFTNTSCVSATRAGLGRSVRRGRRALTAPCSNVKSERSFRKH